MPPVSQLAGWFQGRAEALSGSTLLQPALISVSNASSRRIQEKLTAKRFTIRDMRE